MTDFDTRNNIKQRLGVLFRAIDGRQGTFSKFEYASLLDIFHEPAAKETGLDQSWAEATFMARRLWQAMPLYAAMGLTEENSLSNIIRDVDQWKELSGYFYHSDAEPVGGEMPNSSDTKRIGHIARDYFVKFGLDDISLTNGGGYITCRGNAFLDEFSLRLTFDIRQKYGWSMRFNIGLFSKGGLTICNVSDLEVFGKIIYDELGLKFDKPFELCCKSGADYRGLDNYLSVVEAILSEIRTWRS